MFGNRFFAFSNFLNFSTTKVQDVADLSNPIVEPISVEIPGSLLPRHNRILLFQSRKLRINRSRSFCIETDSDKSAEIKKTTQIASHRKASTATQTKEYKEVKISQEEQYAYDQLMLALSIASSKLKEVKDKANGNDAKIAEIDSLK